MDSLNAGKEKSQSTAFDYIYIPLAFCREE